MTSIMKKFLFGCLGVVALLGVLAAAGIWYLFVHEAPQLDATLDVPSEVTVGVPFDLRVKMTNSHTRPVTLDSIDIDEAFLEGFQVQRVTPAARSTSRVPLLNQRTWAFDHPVAPGASHEVVFSLRPVRAGHRSGNVDVCNPSQDFRTLLADVVILDAADEAPSEAPAPDA